MSVQQIAHASGGLGAWARYRTYQEVQVDPIGPSSIESVELGIISGESLIRFGRVGSLDEFERNQDVIPDADGNLGIVERADVDRRRARILLDVYLLGDARMSAAAGELLEEMAHDL